MYRCLGTPFYGLKIVAAIALLVFRQFMFCREIGYNVSCWI